LFGQLFGMKKVSVRLSSLIVHAPHWSIMRLALTGVGELPVRVDVEYQYLSVIPFGLDVEHRLNHQPAPRRLAQFFSRYRSLSTSGVLNIIPFDGDPTA